MLEVLIDEPLLKSNILVALVVCSLEESRNELDKRTIINLSEVIQEELPDSDFLVFDNGSTDTSNLSLLMHLYGKYMNAIPTVVIEVTASGLLIIYSSTYGVPEIVGQNGGIGLKQKEIWELEPHSPNRGLLCEDMRAIIRNQNLYSLAARERAVAKFNIKKWITKHKEVSSAYL